MIFEENFGQADITLGANNTIAIKFSESNTSITIAAAAGGRLGDVLQSITFGDGVQLNQTQIIGLLRGAATDGNDIIHAIDNETLNISGLGGDDQIYGSIGDDTLNGDAGNDYLGIVN